MQTYYRIVLARFLLFRRLLARRLGFWLIGLERQPTAFGEHHECSWSASAFLRLESTEIEITDFFPRSYLGPVYAARFEHCGKKGKRCVVLSLNWIVAEDQSFDEFAEPLVRQVFGGTCEIAIDPVASPLHELPDGTLWFMWPQGGYAVFRRRTDRSPFSGDPHTPRVYKYF